MAYSKDKEEDILYNAAIIKTFAEISKDDVHQLASCITNFIAVSVCPYNIDQPIYQFDGYTEHDVTAFSDTYNLVDISSAFQRENGIKSLVLDIPLGFLSRSSLSESVELCKIRFLFGQYNDKCKFLAVPFVLFKEMGDEVLDAITSATEYRNQRA